jgi:aldose 1-epimerase
MKHALCGIGVLVWAVTLSCTSQTAGNGGKSGVTRQPFGSSADGVPVELYTLTNEMGMKVSIATYGGAVVSLTAPDRAGKFADIVLGCDDVRGYEKQDAYFGALIGRYGNRIGGAQFTLDGVEYRLARNNGANTLHGGPRGFDKRVWHAREVDRPEGSAVRLTYVSEDGEEGFPGNLSVTVDYILTAKNELTIAYTAETSRNTVVNLTNHSYFNLAGQGEGDILEHGVMINADRYLPVDSGLIPTGELRAVKGTPFDFTNATTIGPRIGQNDQQLKFGKGYDHNWVLNRSNGGMSKAAEVYEPKGGRVMEVWTTEPGLQFYTGNFLDGTIHGKGGRVYAHRGGFVMETQHFPDSPNKAGFPSTLLKPGTVYASKTTYKFSAR